MIISTWSVIFFPKVIEITISPILYFAMQFMILAIYLNLFTLSRINSLTNYNWEFNWLIFHLSHIKKIHAKLPEFRIIKTIKTNAIKPCNRRFPNIKDNENPYQILVSVKSKSQNP